MMLENEQKKKDPIWKHAKVGVPRYAKADDLWQDALLYFEWCDNNPVDAPMNVIRYKKEKHGGSKEMKKQDQQENVSRPYTLFGLAAFTGIPRWHKFKSDNREREGFDEVICAIENVIISQQIDGAMTGVFKENLTARLNGISDRTQTELSGEVDVNNEHKFTGFSFLPFTEGLQNSEQAKVACGEVVEELPMPEEKTEPLPLYAEIVDVPKEEEPIWMQQE